jgi:hypothetical protein
MNERKVDTQDLKQTINGNIFLAYIISLNEGLYREGELAPFLIL